MLCFHGTTKHRADEIIFNGSNKKYPSCWSCSGFDDMFYVWALEPMAISEQCNSWEEAADRCLDYAIDSARAQAAASLACVTELEVLVFDVAESLLLPDASCENMAGSGAMRLPLNIGPCLDHVATYACGHAPRLDACIVAGLLKNKYFTAQDPAVYVLAECLAAAGVYIEPDNYPEPYLVYGSREKLRKKFPNKNIEGVA